MGEEGRTQEDQISLDGTIELKLNARTISKDKTTHGSHNGDDDDESLTAGIITIAKCLKGLWLREIGKIIEPYYYDT